MIEPWRRQRAERLLRCRVFNIDRVHFRPPDGGRPHAFYRLTAPDWINVIPVTPEGDVLFVRQYRFGVEDLTLEIPGGMCDPGETPRRAARRELREETGFRARKLIELGWVHPNPAIQDNRCWTYLARDVVRVGAARPDVHESFDLVRVPFGEVSERIRRAEITHALVVSAFQLLQASDDPTLRRPFRAPARRPPS